MFSCQIHVFASFVFVVLTSCGADESSQSSRVIFPLVNDEKESIFCTTQSGGEGVCTNIEECESVLATISTQHPNICYFEKNLPVVCCPLQESTTTATDFPINQPITTEDPFETKLYENCGERANISPEGGVQLETDEDVVTNENKSESSYSWPWTVAVMKFSLVGTSNFLCSGTLINPRFILVAAHCFDDNARPLQPPRYEVLAGLDEQGGGVPYGVEKITIHERYTPRKHDNDLALLKLSEDIDYNDEIRAICLPTSNTFVTEDDALTGRLATATKWGPVALVSRGTTARLEESAMRIVSNQACNESLFHSEFLRLENGISDNQLCAKYSHNEEASCQDSSVGPLVINDENNRWHIVGVSSSRRNCSVPGSPGIYTRVTSYLPWIKEHSKTSPTAHLKELYRNFILQRARKQKQ